MLDEFGYSWSVTKAKRVPLFPLLWYVHVLSGSVIMQPRLLGITRLHATGRGYAWIGRNVR